MIEYRDVIEQLASLPKEADANAILSDVAHLLRAQPHTRIERDDFNIILKRLSESILQTTEWEWIFDGLSANARFCPNMPFPIFDETFGLRKQTATPLGFSLRHWDKGGLSFAVSLLKTGNVPHTAQYGLYRFKHLIQQIPMDVKKSKQRIFRHVLGRVCQERYNLNIKF